MPHSVWMVRAGNSNELVDVFAEHSLVAVGWASLGDLSDRTAREEVKERYREAYEKRKEQRVNTDAAQLHAFVNRMEKGDQVLTYDKDAREYYAGTIKGGYQFDASDETEPYPHIRAVDWEDETLSRDSFSTSAQNTLGGALTVFSLNNCKKEIEQLLGGDDIDGDSGDEEPPYIEEVESRSEELISDIVSDIDPLDLEELVAGVLRAMGYTAQTTKEGGDFGIDVIAHPDALGFEEPRVKVQVKHTKSAVGNSAVGRFLGTLSNDEKGLYISTGGYTKPARMEAQTHGQNITLLDRDNFIDLLLEHYSGLEQEYQAMVPLKRVYVPTKE